MHSSRFYTLLALVGILSEASSSSIPIRRSETPHLLMARDDTNCHDVDPRLPTNFKCQIQSSKCISLDNGSSAICCTDDSQKCTNIQPIACNIQSQNITRFPGSAIFTTALDRTPSTCGQKCCPFGYDCITPAPANGDPFCNMTIADSSLAGSVPESASSSSSSSTSTSSTSKSTPSATSAVAVTTGLSTGIDSTKSQGSGKDAFPPGVFLAGLFPGMVVGALLLLAWVIYSGRHNKPDSSDSSRHSGSSHRPIISDPIPMTGGVRTDFLRRARDRVSRAKSTFSNRDSRIDSNPWKNPVPPVPSNIPPLPAGLPVTPKNRVNREPSVESIRVYTPPSMIQHPSATVPPLRSMTAQRQPTFGSPFETPTKANGAYEYDAPAPDHAEILAPQRYEAEPRLKRYEEYESNDPSRRDTSFTALMAHCNIPDKGDEFPVPKIPKPYETRL